MPSGAGKGGDEVCACVGGTVFNHRHRKRSISERHDQNCDMDLMARQDPAPHVCDEPALAPRVDAGCGSGVARTLEYPVLVP